MATWEDFGDGLTAALRQVADRVFLIIASEGDPTRYVQFAGQPGRLDAEAPSIDVVSGARESVLVDTGWTPPGPAQPNWSSSLPRPALTDEYRALAQRCVAALRDAYGIESPDELAYRAWRDAELIPAGETWSEESIARLDRGEDALDLPMLGLPAN
ncbi:TY-Chap domain-containing protein [Microbacterium sp. NPDC089695]|uniref:TY-Chap domain-containing protein n=1 Tax=Microbacterium sp. NPDC089695 TaxID=3364198 RepID=UPI0038155EFC